MTTQTPSLLALETAFRRLVTEWREATQFDAAPSAAAIHPAYRAMVALGPDILPLLFAALRSEPCPAWFAALRELTGADPVPEPERGRTAAMTGRWMAWGHAHGMA